MHTEIFSTRLRILDCSKIEKRYVPDNGSIFINFELVFLYRDREIKRLHSKIDLPPSSVGASSFPLDTRRPWGVLVLGLTRFEKCYGVLEHRNILNFEKTHT